MPPAAFGQARPRWYCPRRRLYHELSVQAGHRVRCRDPHCSKDCRENWANKERAITGRIIKDISDAGPIRVYRGCLKMPPGSTVSDHQTAISKAVRSLRNRRHRYRDERLELEAVAHITKTDAMHWDIIVVADAGMSGDRVREVVRGVWERAGGVFRSLVERCPAEVVYEVEYTFKTRVRGAITLSGKRLLPHDPGLLPARNGLPVRWGSVGFSRGRDSVWRRLVAQWFPAGSHTTNTSASSSHPDDPITAQIAAEMAPATAPDLPDPDRQDKYIVEAVLPTCEDDALPLSLIAHRAGLVIDRTLKIIRDEVWRSYRTTGPVVNLYWLRRPGGRPATRSVRAGTAG